MTPISPLCELEVPLDRIERALAVGTAPDFTGFVDIGFRIKPSALDCITMLVQYEGTHHSKALPVESLVTGASERELMLVAGLQIVRPNLRLKMGLVSLRGHFKAGKLERITEGHAQTIE